MILQKITVLALMEEKNSQITQASYQALECAAMLETGAAKKPLALVISENPESAAKKIAAGTGCDVLGIKAEGFKDYPADAMMEAICAACDMLLPRWLVMPQAPLSQNFGPGLSIKLDGAYIPSVNRLTIKKDGAVFTRMLAGGKFYMNISAKKFPGVINILPGAFKEFMSETKKSGTIHIKTINIKPGKARIVERIRHKSGEHNLDQAKVIIACGRGLGEIENLPLIKKTAALFHRSAVAGSRAAIDLGWLHPRLQIGMTGQTVAPELYMACGISGALQHTMGMAGSRLVVAINTDPAAPIFRIADYCVVEDMKSFLPIFMKEWTREEKGP